MKRQICVTLDEETHSRMIRKVDKIRFKSKSHLMECAIAQLLKEEEEE